MTRADAWQIAIDLITREIDHYAGPLRPAVLAELAEARTILQRLQTGADR